MVFSGFSLLHPVNQCLAPCVLGPKLGKEFALHYTGSNTKIGQHLKHAFRNLDLAGAAWRNPLSDRAFGGKTWVRRSGV